MDIFDARRCELGEGALWHPGRGQLFWFDILGNRLLSRGGGRPSGEDEPAGEGAPLAWEFGERVSAAGWIDRDRLLLASETGLWRLDLATGGRERVAAFPQAPHLRSNDGRADPWGGFWIGTMGKRAEARAGALWRWWRGEFRRTHPAITIPNAVCIDPEREILHFADTMKGRVWRQRLDPGTGWPFGAPELYLDLAAREGTAPDGAVLDAKGRFWTAQWGAGRVACYDAAGALVAAERFPARQLSCPAFGGEGFSRLFVTSAMEGLDAAARAAEPEAGMTFARDTPARGRPEPRVEV